MPDAARDLIQSSMSRATAPRPFSAYAPSNIALAKYWGKRDRALNLPLNSSLSISLGQWGSHTDIRPSTTGEDLVYLDNTQLPKSSAFARKALEFVDLFRRGREDPLEIRTRNTIPTASGLASSASGFAALTQALCGCYGLDLTAPQKSLIARLGSGSATRSLWHGFVRWDRGNAPDGQDSIGTPLAHIWPEFRIAIVKIDIGPKAFSSRDGMNHTVETSPLFQAWPEQAEKDCAAIERAIEERDFRKLGETAEANALAMHATMQAARPALTYLTAGSWAVLERLWTARRDGMDVYATMDAGANVKLIFLSDQTDDVCRVFPEADIVQPFEAQAL
jgi:diphosphomevalonate decarboxylase